MYPRLVRPILFLLDAEFSHRLTLRVLRTLYLIPGISFIVRLIWGGRTHDIGIDAMGMHFPNPVGLAAGLDKNGGNARFFSDIGFGFIELGTVTPKRQSGNPRKRLFRLPKHRALINRMGFPSIGVNHFLLRLRMAGRRGIVGINIGKNASTPIDKASDDYLAALQAVYPYASYIAINISSPNTSQLRQLQKESGLDELLGVLKNEQIMMGKTRHHYVPIAVKIAPDLTDDEIVTIAELVMKHKIDAVIATNTTVERTGIENELLAQESGGLSGPPLKHMSTEIIRKLYNQLQGKVPIIGIGGIETAADAWEKMVAGADLVQLYTAFIYEGPAVVRRITRGLERRVRTSGCANLTDAIQKARSGIHLMR